ncbi:MAG: oligosaccharide flippase family protein, partial [Deltaproteobacteria bacterium]|nr:oligosaccharide flippase family protein [Deltaproteobacteria bacterium]
MPALICSLMNNFAPSERTPPPTLTGPVPGDTYLAKLAQGAAIVLVGRVFGRATSALTHVILARFLGPQDFGLYAIGWTTLQLGGALAVLGLDKGIMYYGSGHRETDQYLVHSVLRQSIGLACALGIVFGTGLYLCAPWLATQVFGKANLISVMCLFAPAFCFFSGLRVAAAASRISQRMQFSIYTE